MQVDALLIDSFTLSGDGTVNAHSLLVRFENPTYVGARGVQGSAGFKTTPFPSRRLTIDRGRRDRFDYAEPWTVPSWTLYVVAPPQEFTAEIRFTEVSEPLTSRPAADAGVLYYYALVQGSGERVRFDVAARFERNARRYERVIARADRFNREWPCLWEAVARPLSTTADLLTIGLAIESMVN
jgi:hypothetical protein